MTYHLLCHLQKTIIGTKILDTQNTVRNKQVSVRQQIYSFDKNVKMLNSVTTTGR